MGFASDSAHRDSVSRSASWGPAVSRMPGQVEANHPSSSAWRAADASALRIARIPAPTSSRAVWPTSTLT